MSDDYELIGCHNLNIRGGIYKNGEPGVELILEKAFRLRFTLAEAAAFSQRLSDCIEEVRIKHDPEYPRPAVPEGAVP